MMFRGSLPALVTLFRDEALDEGAYRAFVDWQIAEGSHGLVPAGTTGESATLTPAEHRRIIEICMEAAAGGIPVIAGCGSNDTAHAIALTRAAKDAGASAALHVPPRTITDISVETMARLAKLPNIVAVKDATGNLARISAQRLACGADFI